jgi:proline iminopeptidase
MKRSRKLPRGAGRFQTNDGLSLWYKIAGRGPALLVPSPGWGASVDVYMKSLGPLQRHFSVIYLDTRGAGRSDAPAKGSGGFKFRYFLADLESLRVHLQLKRWLIFAHSDAALQAIGYAINHPKQTCGLFIVDGTVNVNAKEVDIDARAREKKLSQEPWFAAAKKAEQKTSRTTITNDQFKEAFVGDLLPLYFASDKAAAQARHYFSASTYSVEGNMYDYHAPHFRTKMLAQVQVPTAVFVGDQDVITPPAEALRLDRSITNSTLFVIRNAGHFPWLQQRNTFFRDFTQAAQMILKGMR